MMMVIAVQLLAPGRPALSTSISSASSRSVEIVVHEILIIIIIIVSIGRDLAKPPLVIVSQRG